MELGGSVIGFDCTRIFYFFLKNQSQSRCVFPSLWEGHWPGEHNYSSHFVDVFIDIVSGMVTRLIGWPMVSIV